MRNPWAYKIDYAKAIEADLAEIARYERIIALGLFTPADWAAQGYATTAHDLALRDPAVREALGLSDEDMRALAVARGFADAEPAPGRYARGCEIRAAHVAAYGVYLETEAVIRDRLRLARAALARHRRNQRKTS